MQEGLVAACVEMTPRPLGKMVVDGIFAHAFRTMKAAFPVLYPNIDSLCVCKALDALHIPWRWQAKHILVETD
jgi:hypothetical protein